MYGIRQPVCRVARRAKQVHLHCLPRLCVQHKTECAECVQHTTSRTEPIGNHRLLASLCTGSACVLPIELARLAVHWRSNWPARMLAAASDSRIVGHTMVIVHTVHRAFWLCLALFARAVCSPRAFTVCLLPAQCVHGRNAQEAARLALPVWYAVCGLGSL